MTIRVALVDDQNLVRQGIRGLLELSADVEVVGEADDGAQACDLVQACNPDVVLMDLRMPGMNGVEAIETLSAAGYATPVIILTTFDDHEPVLDGLRAGAKGYLLKDVSLDHLLAAIQSVARGETMIQPAITENLLKALGERPPSGQPLEMAEAMTPREIEVLRLMAGGYSNKEISAALSKSEGTVKNQVSSILSKLQVRDRTRAVLKAIEAKLI